MIPKFYKDSLEIAQNYDHFILDIWGVIHDGADVYDGVLDALKYLKKLNKKVYFLSNAPRRASKIISKLEEFTIDQSYYEFIMTSGEATHLYLQENQQNNFNKFGRNYYYIGPKKDEDLLNDLSYERAHDAKKANFAIVTGFDHDLSKESEKKHDLENCLKYNLTLICVNPDMMVIRKSGQEMLCAGLIASQYEKMGGKVIYFGKPHEIVYDKLLTIAKISDKKRVIAIGDSLSTDIKGANQNNIDSALIAGGILSKILKTNHGQLPEVKDLIKLTDEYKAYPKFVLGKI